MDLTIEISERDHASVRNMLFSIRHKPDSKCKLSNGCVQLRYDDLTEDEVDSIKEKSNNNWKITIKN